MHNIYYLGLSGEHRCPLGYLLVFLPLLRGDPRRFKCSQFHKGTLDFNFECIKLLQNDFCKQRHITLNVTIPGQDRICPKTHLCRTFLLSIYTCDIVSNQQITMDSLHKYTSNTNSILKEHLDDGFQNLLIVKIFCCC